MKSGATPTPSYFLLRLTSSYSLLTYNLPQQPPYNPTPYNPDNPTPTLKFDERPPLRVGRSSPLSLPSFELVVSCGGCKVLSDYNALLLLFDELPLQPLPTSSFHPTPRPVVKGESHPKTSAEFW